MIFIYDITIPPNTAKDKPITLDAPLPRGVIHKLDVHFPAGCVGLVGVKVTRSGMPIYPSNQGEWFITDDETISFPEYYEIKKSEPPFTIHAFNEDESYSHTITFRFGVLPKEVLK